MQLTNARAASSRFCAHPERTIPESNVIRVKARLTHGIFTLWMRYNGGSAANAFWWSPIINSVLISVY